MASSKYAALQSILDRVKKKRIIIIGDIILDEYIWGDVNRISPEAPVPVLELVSETTRFGGAANLAHNAISLGGQVDLIGVIGDDSSGTTLIKMLQAVGIDTDSVCTDPSRPTSTKIRVIARTSSTNSSTHQHIVRIDRESKTPINDDIRGRLLKGALDCIPKADAVIFGDYDKGVVSAEFIQAVREVARRHQKPVIGDPKAENFWSYSGVTLITPNHKEAGSAVNRQITDEESLLAVGEEILNKLNIEGLLITRGEQGMSLFRQSSDGQLQVDHIPPRSGEVFDVTGAGDTVGTVFTLALAAQADMLDAAQLSNLAGGVVVGEVGCVAITREALSNAIRLETLNEGNFS